MKSGNPTQYMKLIAFNNILSSQRITIERAFGILVRRWGILWRPIAFKMKKVSKIVRVCAMLHNICVDRWKINNPIKYGDRGQRWPDDVPDSITGDSIFPEEKEIIKRLHNNYIVERKRNVNQGLRSCITEDIYDAGLRANRDTEHLPIPR